MRKKSFNKEERAVAKKIKVTRRAEDEYATEFDPFEQGYREFMEHESDEFKYVLPSCFAQMSFRPPREELKAVSGMDEAFVTQRGVAQYLEGQRQARLIKKCLGCSQYQRCALATLVGKTSSIREKTKPVPEDE
jgi:hypothetical protein